MARVLRKRPKKSKTGRPSKKDIKKWEMPGPAAQRKKDRNWKWTPPKNPDATFSGLPTEIRLRIYEYSCESSIIHVHRRGVTKTKAPRFTWTLCRAPDPSCPLLCANPKWSALCKEKDRCTYKVYEAQPDPTGFAALSMTCRRIRSEVMGFFLRHTVVSIHPRDLSRWLDHVERNSSQGLNNVRRITLAGPNNDKNFLDLDFEKIHKRIPNIESIAIQCQDDWGDWEEEHDDFRDYVRIDPEWWRHQVEELDVVYFNPNITVAVESIIDNQWSFSYCNKMRREQATIRIIRKGRDAGDLESGKNGWEDEYVAIDVYRPGHVVEKSTAGWETWWPKNLFGYKLFTF